MKPPGPQVESNPTPRSALIGTTEEIERLKHILRQQRADSKTKRIELIANNTQVAHTEAQLNGAKQLLGELIWD